MMKQHGPVLDSDSIYLQASSSSSHASGLLSYKNTRWNQHRRELRQTRISHRCKNVYLSTCFHSKQTRFSRTNMRHNVSDCACIRWRRPPKSHIGNYRFAKGTSILPNWKDRYGCFTSWNPKLMMHWEQSLSFPLNNTENRQWRNIFWIPHNEWGQMEVLQETTILQVCLKKFLPKFLPKAETFWKLDTIRSSCFPKTSSRYLHRLFSEKGSIYILTNNNKIHFYRESPQRQTTCFESSIWLLFQTMRLLTTLHSF